MKKKKNMNTDSDSMFETERRERRQEAEMSKMNDELCLIFPPFKAIQVRGFAAEMRADFYGDEAEFWELIYLEFFI